MSNPTTIDARGLKCPMPVLKLEKKLDQIPSGTTLILISDDPIARIDVPLLCKKKNHSCTVEKRETALHFTVTKR